MASIGDLATFWFQAAWLAAERAVGEPLKAGNTRQPPIFGGFEDKTSAEAELAADAPVLNVRAAAIFGGVDVKNATD